MKIARRFNRWYDTQPEPNRFFWMLGIILPAIVLVNCESTALRLTGFSILMGFTIVRLVN